MLCTFDTATCQTTCPKFVICMYNSIQKQIIELNKQVNFLFLSFSNSTLENISIKEEIEKLKTDRDDLLSACLQLSNDSETIQTTTKESLKNEKIN